MRAGTLVSRSGGSQSTPVVISIHGAGLTNVMWMRYQTTVIEIYPYKMVNFCYKYLSDACGLYHFPVYTYTPPKLYKVSSKEQYEWEQRCNQVFNTQIEADCYNKSKNSAVWVDIQRLKNAVIDAFQIIGYVL